MSQITATFSFTASNFALIPGSDAFAPPLPVIEGAFHLSFDPTTDAVNQTSGIVLDRINMPFDSGAIGFSYHLNPLADAAHQQQLTIGGISPIDYYDHEDATFNGYLADLGVGSGSNDFFLDFYGAAGASPRFSMLVYSQEATPHASFWTLSGQVVDDPPVIQGAQVVPEPSSLVIMAAALAMLGVSRWRKLSKGGWDDRLLARHPAHCAASSSPADPAHRRRGPAQGDAPHRSQEDRLGLRGGWWRRDRRWRCVGAALIRCAAQRGGPRWGCWRRRPRLYRPADISGFAIPIVKHQRYLVRP